MKNKKHQTKFIVGRWEMHLLKEHFLKECREGVKCFLTLKRLLASDPNNTQAAKSLEEWRKWIKSDAAEARAICEKLGEHFGKLPKIKPAIAGGVQ